MPFLDPAEPIRVAPDWVCEVLSPTTRAYDRRVKLPYYARIGVSHCWVIDPDARTLEVKRLVAGAWTDIAVLADDEVARVEPFEEVGIELADLWLPLGR